MLASRCKQRTPVVGHRQGIRDTGENGPRQFGPVDTGQVYIMLGHGRMCVRSNIHIRTLLYAINAQAPCAPSHESTIAVAASVQMSMIQRNQPQNSTLSAIFHLDVVSNAGIDATRARSRLFHDCDTSEI